MTLVNINILLFFFRERRFAKNKSTTETELSAFGRMVNVFVRDLLNHIDKVTKNVFQPSLISGVLATNVKSFLEGAKDALGKCQVTLDIAAISKYLPEKYIPIVGVVRASNYDDCSVQAMQPELDIKKPMDTENETVSVNVQGATPDSKTKLADLSNYPNKPSNITEEQSAEIESSYVIDRVDLIAKEIEKSKISESESTS